MSTHPQTQITAEEFAALPLGEMRSELIEGVLHTMPPTTGGHGRITMRLSGLLFTHISNHHLGETYAAETGFLIARNPDTVRAPDFAFIQRDRAPSHDMDARWVSVIPDLVVEVASPGDRPTELMDKAEMWLEVGVRLVWVALPAQRVIQVYRPGQPIATLDMASMLDGGEVVPGFTTPVAHIYG